MVTADVNGSSVYGLAAVQTVSPYARDPSFMNPRRSSILFNPNFFDVYNPLVTYPE